MEVIRSLPAGGETMETIADMLEQRGYEKALNTEKDHWVSEGELKKSREMLLEAISEKFGTISADLVRRINSVEAHETLKMLFKQTFRMDSLDEFQKQVHRATDN